MSVNIITETTTADFEQGYLQDVTANEDALIASASGGFRVGPAIPIDNVTGVTIDFADSGANGIMLITYISDSDTIDPADFPSYTEQVKGEPITGLPENTTGKYLLVGLNLPSNAEIYDITITLTVAETYDVITSGRNNVADSFKEIDLSLFVVQNLSKLTYCEIVVTDGTPAINTGLKLAPLAKYPINMLAGYKAYIRSLGSEIETAIINMSVAQPKGLKGDKGDKGDQGIQGIAGIDGVDGKSAYDLWIEEGHVGTQTDFINWIRDEFADIDLTPYAEKTYVDNAINNIDLSVSKRLATTYTITAHGFALDTILPLSATDAGFVLTDITGENTTTCDFLGVALDVNTLVIYNSGIMSEPDNDTFVAGTYYYLGKTSVGAITDTKPTSGIDQTLFKCFSVGASKFLYVICDPSFDVILDEEDVTIDDAIARSNVIMQGTLDDPIVLGSDALTYPAETWFSDVNGLVKRATDSIDNSAYPGGEFDGKFEIVSLDTLYSLIKTNLLASTTNTNNVADHETRISSNEDALSTATGNIDGLLSVTSEGWAKKEILAIRMKLTGLDMGDNAWIDLFEEGNFYLTPSVVYDYSFGFDTNYIQDHADWTVSGNVVSETLADSKLKVEVGSSAQRVYTLGTADLTTTDKKYIAFTYKGNTTAAGETYDGLCVSIKDGVKGVNVYLKNNGEIFAWNGGYQAIASGFDFSVEHDYVIESDDTNGLVIYQGGESIATVPYTGYFNTSGNLIEIGVWGSTYAELANLNIAKAATLTTSAEYISETCVATAVLNTMVSEAIFDEGDTGTITFSVSRDNGTTWTEIQDDTVIDISAQPSDTNVKIKVVVTGDAILYGLAWGGIA